jgi:hypothetical protein
MVTTLAAAGSDDTTPTFGFHPSTKAMISDTFNFTWLIRSFHFLFSPLHELIDF